MTQPSPEPPTPLSQLAFRPTRFREGYDVTEVDEFLRRAHRALESEDGSITAEDVRAVRFSPVRLKEGYDMGQVDGELERIAAALQ